MKKSRWLVSAAALIAFIIIAYFVSTGSELAFDTVLREAFYSLRCDWLNAVVIALTHLGDTKSIVAICLVLLIIPKTRMRYGIPVAAASIAASSLNHFIKSIFERPRPDVMNHIIEQGGWSFPSGHSISSLVLFALLIWLIRHYMLTGGKACATEQSPQPGGGQDLQRCRKITNILTVLLLIPCFGIGLSRIYVGVHFPTDVLGGWCLGTIVVIITITIVEAIEKRNKLKTK